MPVHLSFLLRVHRTKGNIEIFRKFEPKRANHKKDPISRLIRRFCVEVPVVCLYKKYSLTYLDCFVCTKRILPAGKGLTSWLSFVVSAVSLSLSNWYPGSGVVLDCIDS